MTVTAALNAAPAETTAIHTSSDSTDSTVCFWFGFFSNGHDDNNHADDKHEDDHANKYDDKNEDNDGGDNNDDDNDDDKNDDNSDNINDEDSCRGSNFIRNDHFCLFP